MKLVYRKRYIDDILIIFSLSKFWEAAPFINENFYPGLTLETKIGCKVEYLGCNLEFLNGFFELSPIIKDIKIVGQSYGAEPRSIVKGYIRRIIDCTVSSKKQQKVIQLVGEAVDMLNARGFKFDKAKKQADAVRVMRELGH